MIERPYWLTCHDDEIIAILEELIEDMRWPHQEKPLKALLNWYEQVIKDDEQTAGGCEECAVELVRDKVLCEVIMALEKELRQYDDGGECYAATEDCIEIVKGMMWPDERM